MIRAQIAIMAKNSAMQAMAAASSIKQCNIPAPSLEQEGNIVHVLF
jgi:hypothetical protein